MQNLSKKKEEYLIEIRKSKFKKRFSLIRRKIVENLKKEKNLNKKTKNENFFEEWIFGKSKNNELIKKEKLEFLQILKKIFSKKHQNLTPEKTGWIITNFLGFSGLGIESENLKEISIFEDFCENINKSVNLTKKEIIEICLFSLSKICEKFGKMRVYLIEENFLFFFVQKYKEFFCDKKILEIFVYFLNCVTKDIFKFKKSSFFLEEFLNDCFFEILKKKNFIYLFDNCEIDLSIFFLNVLDLEKINMKLLNSEFFIFNIIKLFGKKNKIVQKNSILILKKLTYFLDNKDFSKFYSFENINKILELIKIEKNENLLIDFFSFISIIINNEKIRKIILEKKFIYNIYKKIEITNNINLIKNFYKIFKNIFYLKIDNKIINKIFDLKIHHILLKGFSFNFKEIDFLVINIFKKFIGNLILLDFFFYSNIYDFVKIDFCDDLKEWRDIICNEDIDLIYSFFKKSMI